jgi:uncharacterized membrane protein YkoI
MQRRPRPRSGRHRGRGGPLALLIALLIAGPVLAGCDNARMEPPAEVLPQVEFGYEEAFDKALHEVPDTLPLSLDLRSADRPQPVWYARVATSDGTVHEVRLDAVRGGVLGTEVPTGQTASTKSQVKELTEQAELLPSEAVEKVAEPYFGKVTRIGLTAGRGGATVWSVTVAKTGPHDLGTYQVDAVTGEVTGSRYGGPTATSTSPPPFSPPATPLPTLPPVSPPAVPTAPPSTPGPYHPSP